MTVSALLERLSGETHLPILGRDGLADFVARNEFSALCFFNDPKVYPENFDLAVILPEILKAFPQLSAAAVAPAEAAGLARDYGVAVFPALVLLRAGQPQDVVARIQSWSEYRDRIQRLLP